MNLELQFLNCNSQPFAGQKLLFTPTRSPEASESWLRTADSYQFTSSADGTLSQSIVAGLYKVTAGTTDPYNFYVQTSESGSYLYSGSLMSGSAQDVFFDLFNLVKDPTSVKKLTITPSRSYPLVFSSSIVVLSSTSSIPDTGMVEFSTLVPGPYQIDVQGKVVTTFYISVPNWESTGSDAPKWNAKDLLIVKPSKGIKVRLTDADDSYVLTVSSSDARYAPIGASFTSSSYADTASLAVTASYALNASSATSDSASWASSSFSASYAETASVAITASYAANSAAQDLTTYLSSSWTGSNSSQFSGTASYATSASNADNATNANSSSYPWTPATTTIHSGSVVAYGVGVTNGIVVDGTQDPSITFKVTGSSKANIGLCTANSTGDSGDWFRNAFPGDLILRSNPSQSILLGNDVTGAGDGYSTLKISGSKVYATDISCSTITANKITASTLQLTGLDDGNGALWLVGTSSFAVSASHADSSDSALTAAYAIEAATAFQATSAETAEALSTIKMGMSSIRIYDDPQFGVVWDSNENIKAPYLYSTASWAQWAKTANEPTASADIATKHYVDSLIQGSAIFYLSATGSGIDSDYLLKLSGSNPGNITLITASVGDGTYVFTWITPENIPNVTVLPDGLYHIDHTSRKTTATNTVTIYPEIYIADSSGSTYFEVGTVATPFELSDTFERVQQDIVVSTPITMSATDRLVVRLKITNTGTNDIETLVEGDTLSHFATPISNANFIVNVDSASVAISSSYALSASYADKSLVSNFVVPVDADYSDNNIIHLRENVSFFGWSIDTYPDDGYLRISSSTSTTDLITIDANTRFMKIGGAWSGGTANRLEVVGNISASVVTASLFYGTASQAVYAPSSLSSSYALSASYAPGGGGTSLQTGSYYPITSSWANTSSVAISASYAPGGGGTSLQTGSYYPITASWANTASAVVSASYALSASYAPSTGGGTSLETGSTYPITASWAESASMAVSASYAENGGSGGGAADDNVLLVQFFS